MHTRLLQFSEVSGVPSARAIHVRVCYKEDGRQKVPAEVPEFGDEFRLYAC